MFHYVAVTVDPRAGFGDRGCAANGKSHDDFDGTERQGDVGVRLRGLSPARSGQTVTKVILRDGSGHQADPDAVRELQERELITVEGNDIVFGEQAQTLLAAIIEAMRQKLA